ncbi:protein CHROMATIN REMODELING 25 [Neltuma alba]|nr:protein CHROMATIN REMODELING 25-like [Prosopis alba]
MSKEGLQKVIQQEQTDNLETPGNFSTEVLRDLFSFHECVKSEIHERMHCSRCQTNDDGPQSDDGKYVAHSTISNGGFDEETSDDIGGFAKFAGCMHKLKKSEKQVGIPLEEDLGSWGHHFFSTTVPDTILQASAGDEVTFVFTNQVDGKLTPIDSTVSSEQQQEESKEVIQLKRNSKQSPVLSLHQKPSYSLKPSMRPALSSVRTKENISTQAALKTKNSLVNQLPQKRSCPTYVDVDQLE